jgi:DnaK suppressor protein
MFDEKFVAARKTALLKEKSRLEREIESRKKYEQYGESEDDNALEVQAFEQSVSEVANLEKLLGDVKKSLEKIEQGTYGRCEKGSEGIEKDRLIAFPAATVCIKHQQEMEARSTTKWYKPWTWRR